MGDGDLPKSVGTHTDSVSSISYDGLGCRTTIAEAINSSGAVRRGLARNRPDICCRRVQEPGDTVAIGYIDVAGVIHPELLRAHCDVRREGRERSGVRLRSATGDRVDVTVRRRRDAEFGQQTIER